MKKIILILAILAAILLAGCSSGPANNDANLTPGGIESIESACLKEIEFGKQNPQLEKQLGFVLRELTTYRGVKVCHSRQADPASGITTDFFKNTMYTGWTTQSVQTSEYDSNVEKIIGGKNDGKCLSFDCNAVMIEDSAISEEFLCESMKEQYCPKGFANASEIPVNDPKDYPLAPNQSDYNIPNNEIPNPGEISAELPEFNGNIEEYCNAEIELAKQDPESDKELGIVLREFTKYRDENACHRKQISPDPVQEQTVRNFDYYITEPSTLLGSPDKGWWVFSEKNSIYEFTVEKITGGANDGKCISFDCSEKNPENPVKYCNLARNDNCPKGFVN